MKGKITGIFRKTKESICDFTSNPIENLGFLIPIAICLTSIISGIIAYIMFIVNGGYTTQIGFIKSSGIDGLSDGFTTGTTSMLTSGVVAKILVGFVITELIVMLISYFKSRGKVMRIAMIVDLTVFAIMVALSTIVFWIAVGELVISGDQLYRLFGKIEERTINPEVILITYISICLISLICFIVLTLITKECRRMIGYTALSLGFANIIMPLFFLIIQNIIPIAGWFLVIIIGIVAVKVIISFYSDHPNDINWKKEELARAKERSSQYKASAEGNFKDAANGGRLFTSKEECAEQGRKDLKKASYEDEEIRRLQNDIDRLESKFGNQN